MVRLVFGSFAPKEAICSHLTNPFLELFRHQVHLIALIVDLLPTKPSICVATMDPRNPFTITKSSADSRVHHLIPMKKRNVLNMHQNKSQNRGLISADRSNKGYSTTYNTTFLIQVVYKRFIPFVVCL